jgi:hypothetical protein
LNKKINELFDFLSLEVLKVQFEYEAKKKRKGLAGPQDSEDTKTSMQQFS